MTETVAGSNRRAPKRQNPPKIRMQYRRSSAPTDEAVEFTLPSEKAPDEIQILSVSRREGNGFGQFVYDYEYVLIWR